MIKKFRLPGNKKPEDWLFTLGVGTLFSYAVSLNILTSTVIAFTRGGVFWIVGFLTLVIAVAVSDRRITLGVLAAGAFIAFLGWFMGNAWGPASEALANMVLISRGLVVYAGEYDRAFVWLLCFGVTLVTVVFLFAWFNFYVLGVFGAVFFAVSEIMVYNRDPIALYIFLGCFFMLLLKKTSARSLAALLALPMCVGAVVIALILPPFIPRAEVLLELFNQPIEAVSGLLFTAFNPKYFSFQSTGFASSASRMGGPVSPNDKAVMRVDAPARAYLSGATKNIYNGRMWLADTEPFPFPLLGVNGWDYLETRAALAETVYTARPGAAFLSIHVQAASDETPADFIYEAGFPAETDGVNFFELETAFPEGAELRVFISDLRTGTVFTSPYNTGLSFREPKYQQTLIENNLGDRSVTGLMAKGASYAYRYLKPDMQDPATIERLTEARRGFYAELFAPNPYKDLVLIQENMVDETRVARVYQGDGADVARLRRKASYQILQIDINALTRHADYVYENYLSLPISLPGRVTALAHVLTDGFTSPYEKILAVENYLSTITYTLSPPPVPETADLVDYFLFEAPEGYCVYFASAAAVLLREAGIPTRYREGFLLPPRRTNGMYTVTNLCAHAWAEAYLEGYGWLVVEATPPFRSIAEAERGMETTFTRSGNYEDDPYYQAYMRMMYGYNYPNTGNYYGGYGDVPAAEAAAPAAKRFGLALPWYTLALVCAAALLILFILFIIVQRIREAVRHWTVGRYAPDQQAAAYMRAVFRFVGFLFEPMLPEETPLTYGERVRNRFAFRSDSLSVSDLVALYYKAVYSRQGLSVQELQALKESYIFIWRYTRRLKKGVRFFYLRYIRRLTVL